MCAQELMRRGDAADKLVRLLSATDQGAAGVVTTALLALRVLTDRCTSLSQWLLPMSHWHPSQQCPEYITITTHPWQMCLTYMPDHWGSL